VAPISDDNAQDGSYLGGGVLLEAQLSQNSPRESDFFSNWEIEIGHSADKILWISTIDSRCRPRQGDDNRVLILSEIAGLARNEDSPVLITSIKEKAGILGSGLEHRELVAGVRFELTTFGLW